MATLIFRPSLDKKPYRLRCRFRIEPLPNRDRLDREKVRVADRFVQDMHKQGWEHHTGSAFAMKGPFPQVIPVTLRHKRTPSARDMMAGVARGERFLDTGDTEVMEVPLLGESEWWEYEIAGVFIRTQIMAEVPDTHEEVRN